MANHAHTTIVSRRQALGVIAGVAITAAAPVAIADAFDPAAYVAMWEDCGNVVYWSEFSSGKERFGIYLPDEGTFPGFAELRRFNAVRESEEDCGRKVVEYLKARGQRAGQPLI